MDSENEIITTAREQPDTVAPEPDEQVTPAFPTPAASDSAVQDGNNADQEHKKRIRILLIILIVIIAAACAVGICALIVYLMVRAIITTSTVIIQSVTEEIVTGLVDEFIHGLSNL